MNHYDLDYEMAIAFRMETLERLRAQLQKLEDAITSIDWVKEDWGDIEGGMS
jgi:hypothetical protein